MREHECCLTPFLGLPRSTPLPAPKVCCARSIDLPLRGPQVVVFNIEGRDIPIVHRSIKVHERREGTSPRHMDALTKVATSPSS